MYVLMIEREAGAFTLAREVGESWVDAMMEVCAYMDSMEFDWEPLGEWRWAGWGLDSCGEPVILTVSLISPGRSLN